MLFGKRRGMPVALALATTLGLGLGLASLARADGLLFQHTIPREVDAYDFTTGGPFMAPPVPYGHYAKDYVADAQKAAGCITCRLHGLLGGPGAGHGLLHKGGHDGGGFGHGDGAVVDDGSGTGHGAGHGLFGHHGSSSSRHATDGTDGTWRRIGAGFATTWAQPSGQARRSTVRPIDLRAIRLQRRLEALSPLQLLNKIRCGSCGGSDAVRAARVRRALWRSRLRHGSGHGHGGGTGCGLCGGRGCSNCLSGLKSGLHGKLASLAGALHRPKISWFLGAGGPVPITPAMSPIS